MNDKFVVNIITLDKNSITIDDAKIVRIKSKDYNLLIMRDYVAIIGMVDGDFEVESVDNTISLKNIVGYYMNSNNIFNIILKEVNNG